MSSLLKGDVYHPGAYASGGGGREGRGACVLCGGSSGDAEVSDGIEGGEFWEQLDKGQHIRPGADSCGNP